MERYLLAKSEFNLTAADTLIKNGLPAPSVHCSYYSCVQKMLCIVFDKLRSRETFEEEREKYKKGSHAYAIILIKDDLLKNRNIAVGGPQIFKDFQRAIEELKNEREKSDYEDVEINNDMANDAFQLASKVRSILKDNYKI